MGARDRLRYKVEMDRQEIITKIKTIEPLLRARGIGALYLFGSYGRDRAGDDSDIDIFVDAGRDDFYDLSNFMGAYSTLCDTFPDAAIDYGTRDGLSNLIRSAVEAEAQRIF